MTDKELRIKKLENKNGGHHEKRMIWITQDLNDHNLYHWEEDQEKKTLTKAELNKLKAALSEDDTIYLVTVWDGGDKTTS